MIKTFDWTDERIELAKKLAAEGLSCSKIGYELGTTRNSVIGKLSRMGKRTGPIGAVTERAPRNAGRPRVGKPSKPKTSAPVVEMEAPMDLSDIADMNKHALQDVNDVMAGFVETPIVPHQPLTVAHAIEHGPIPFMQLRAVGQCKMPLWGHRERPAIEERFFCGARVDPTSTYCLAHASICFAPVPVNRKPYIGSVRHG